MCICVPLSVIAPVCRCKLHLCVDGGVGELRCFGCKHFVCFCYVIEQHCFHTTAVEQIAISSALAGEPYQVSSEAGSNICLLQFIYEDLPLVMFFHKSNKSWDQQLYRQTRMSMLDDSNPCLHYSLTFV